LGLVWVFVWVFGKVPSKSAFKNGHKKTPGAIETTSLGASGADSQIRTGDLILTKEPKTKKPEFSKPRFESKK